VALYRIAGSSASNSTGSVKRVGWMCGRLLASLANLLDSWIDASAMIAEASMVRGGRNETPSVWMVFR
jgi:hypothetical protein